MKIEAYYRINLMKSVALILSPFFIFFFIMCTTKEGDIFSFEPSVGSISVTSTTPGARVFLDYRDTGQITPALLNNVKAGQHLVHIFLAKYISNPDSISVLVQEGKEISINFEVTNIPNVGSLFITTNPESALVKINKLEFGISPLLVTGLATGQYRVVIEKPGFKTIDTMATIRQDDLVELSTSLKLSLKRLVLFEHFSNTDCVPCVDVDIIFEEVLDSLGAEVVSSIGYHPDVPSASDPFYRAAKEENDARKSFYNVPFSPYALIDGTIFPIVSISGLKQDLVNAITNRAAVPPPNLIMEFMDLNVDLDTLSGSVRVWALEDLPPNIFLKTAVINRSVDMAQPPGINGQTHFIDVMRDFQPSVTGVAINLTDKQKITISFSFIRQSGWPDNLDIVSFIQNNQTKEVLQSIWTVQ
jgi:hypothetical protein